MTWDYIAGFIDGEGSITKRKKSYCLYISQTDQGVLESIKIFSGVGRVYALGKREKHWKDAWLYSSGTTKETHHLLIHIVDKLIIKKELALKAIEVLSGRIREKEGRNNLKGERIIEARVLRRKGWSYRKIGAKLGMDWGYVRRLLLSTKS